MSNVVEIKTPLEECVEVLKKYKERYPLMDYYDAKIEKDEVCDIHFFKVSIKWRGSFVGAIVNDPNKFKVEYLLNMICMTCVSFEVNILLHKYPFEKIKEDN